MSTNGRPDDENVLVPLNPRGILRQPADHGFVDAALRPVIDILDAGVATQPGALEPLLESQVLPPRVLPVHNQRQLVFEGEIARRLILLDGLAVHHALQPHVDQFLYGWLVQHGFLLLVVTGAANVIVPAGPRRVRIRRYGLQIQRVRQNRFHAFVTGRAGNQRPFTGGLQPLRSILLSQAQQPQTRPVTHLRVRIPIQDVLKELRRKASRLPRPIH